MGGWLLRQTAARTRATFRVCLTVDSMTSLQHSFINLRSTSAPELSLRPHAFGKRGKMTQCASKMTPGFGQWGLFFKFQMVAYCGSCHFAKSFSQSKQFFQLQMIAYYRCCHLQGNQQAKRHFTSKVHS